MTTNSIIKAAMLAAVFGLSACSSEKDKDKAEDAASNTGAVEETQSETNPDMKKEAPQMSELDAFRTENLAYLDTNKAKEGVQITESGLQYRIIESGAEGGKSPTAADFVTVHYAGRLIDGTEFDSSYKRGEPATFPAGRLIPGWTEALQLMKEGDKWELAIPADIGYGERGAGGVIPANATLVFDVELIEVLTEAQMRAKAEAMAEAHKDENQAFLDENGTKDGITTTASGLQYRVVKEGEGKSPEATSMVTVHYKGTMIDGTQFDSSYDRGEPASFPLDGVIAGWTEGLQLMKEGATYEFFIPYDIAYGERGSRSIPPFSTLIFTVELISVDS